MSDHHLRTLGGLALILSAVSGSLGFLTEILLTDWGSTLSAFMLFLRGVAHEAMNLTMPKLRKAAWAVCVMSYTAFYCINLLVNEPGDGYE